MDDGYSQFQIKIMEWWLKHFTKEFVFEWIFSHLPAIRGLESSFQMLSSIHEPFIEVVHSIQGKRMDECFCKDLDGTMAVEEIVHFLQFQGLQGVAQNQPTAFDDEDRRFGVRLTQAQNLNVVIACIWFI